MAFVPKQNICYLVKHENCNCCPVSLSDFHITYNNGMNWVSQCSWIFKTTSLLRMFRQTFAFQNRVFEQFDEFEKSVFKSSSVLRNIIFCTCCCLKKYLLGDTVGLPTMGASTQPCKKSLGMGQSPCGHQKPCDASEDASLRKTAIPCLSYCKWTNYHLIQILN